MAYILSGYVSVVTGAAQGLGKAIAQALAHAGSLVVVMDILGEKARETSSEIRALGIDSEAIEVDVTNFARTREAINLVIEKFGKIDILVNNAGKGQRKPFLEVTEEIWDYTFDVNCKSVFNLCSAVVPHMLRLKQGCIINISSVSAIRGGDGLLSKNAYPAAKGAVISFSKALARELSENNIRVNCIAPGPHRTRATANITEEEKERLLKPIPMGRLGDPADLGQAVVFLASPAANFITGATLVIDGGYATF